MASPFPGMDPYIEASGLWEDFHDSLIAEIKNALADCLPDRYIVRSGERSYVVLDATNGADQIELQTKADVAVTQSSRWDSSAQERPSTAILDTPAESSTPLMMRAMVEKEFRESFVEIRELDPDRRLVTTIEILSPSNKRLGTTGWTRYQRKRQAHLEGFANLVEIDLLRGGHRMPMEDDWPESPYYLLVSRRQEAPCCNVWPANFTVPLPAISVPLAPPDADVGLDLQPMIHTIYGRSRYERDIDYRRPCRPPLNSTETEWLCQRLDHLSQSPTD